LPQEPKPTRVVTSLLESGGKILILLRSKKVGSYQGKWGGVAGFIETDPDTQALTEIREETGLQSTDVTLIRKGVPLQVEDKVLDRKWTVHPYLFHVRDKSKIRIDWEHSEMKWVSPADLGKFDTVPGLKQVLTAVFPITAE
jgi:8-oxo-dGTP pyrophosphatase MutT (NUDIX family)